MVKDARYRVRVSPVAPGLGFSNSVTIRATEPNFYFKMKLTYEFRGVDNNLIPVGPVVFSENRSEHFASLCSKISPAHIVCINLSYKKGFGK